MKRTTFITFLSLALTGTSLLAEEKQPAHLKVGEAILKAANESASL